MWIVDFVNPLPNIVCFSHFYISIHSLIPQEFIDFLLYSRKGGTIWEYKSKENVTYSKEIEFSEKNNNNLVMCGNDHTEQYCKLKWQPP